MKKQYLIEAEKSRIEAEKSRIEAEKDIKDGNDKLDRICKQFWDFWNNRWEQVEEFFFEKIHKF